MPVISLLAHSDSIIWTFSPYCHHNHRKHSHHHKYIYHSRQITAFTAVFLLIIGWVPSSDLGEPRWAGLLLTSDSAPVAGWHRQIWLPFEWRIADMDSCLNEGSAAADFYARTFWCWPQKQLCPDWLDDAQHICCHEWRVSSAKLSFSSLSIPSHEKGNWEPNSMTSVGTLKLRVTVLNCPKKVAGIADFLSSITPNDGRQSPYVDICSIFLNQASQKGNSLNPSESHLTLSTTNIRSNPVEVMNSQMCLCPNCQ